MKVSLDGLKVVDAIARRGSFAAAAAELHRVPSAISHMVQKLEQDLGVQLFDRSGHTARLTSVGEDLLKSGRPLLRAARLLEHRVQRVAMGWEPQVRIAHDQLIADYRLYGLVADFYSQHVITQLTVRSEAIGGAWQALVSGRADMSIGAGGDARNEPGIATLPLGEVEWVFAVAPRHPLAEASQPLATCDILAHRAVLLDDRMNDQPLVSPPYALNFADALLVSSLRAKIDVQLAGLGVGFLPRHSIAGMLRDGRLIALSVEEPLANTAVYCAWRPHALGKAQQWLISRMADLEVPPGSRRMDPRPSAGVAAAAPPRAA